MTAAAQGRQIVRIRYAKAGRIRFVGHRDVARLFERAMRKLRLPVAFTEGFSPRPKLSFGLALPVACESDAEYLDVELATPADLESLPADLTAALPDGFTVEAAIAIAPGQPSLQQAITSCDWSIEILGAADAGIRAAIDQVLTAPELPMERIRKGKPTVTDVRPAILHVECAGPTSDGVELVASLATETVSLRPAELVQLLGSVLGERTLSEGRIRRLKQWMIVDGARCEPVSPPGSSTRPALVRAS
ncbi:MAG: TIGR03936 family radical SAM-associated protein [Acidimicrobiia bacterium]|nr:TIGR03936 family radical SAM-associated protein [Acidimicrobiia bacterium]MDH5289121.1 TIGR03936 family radical SAM-associated protein [Acidimicrobiia bacterium]